MFTPVDPPGWLQGGFSVLARHGMDGGRDLG
jgi:hypothetical protein